MAVALVAVGPSFPPASILASPRQRRSDEVRTRSATVVFLRRIINGCPTGGRSSRCWEAMLSQSDLLGLQGTVMNGIKWKEVFSAFTVVASTPWRWPFISFIAFGGNWVAYLKSSLLVILNVFVSRTEMLDAGGNRTPGVCVRAMAVTF